MPSKVAVMCPTDAIRRPASAQRARGNPACADRAMQLNAFGPSGSYAAIQRARKSSHWSKDMKRSCSRSFGRTLGLTRCAVDG